MQINNPPTAADIGAVPTSREIIAGANMTGGGDLTADVNLAATGGGGAFSGALVKLNADLVAVNYSAGLALPFDSEIYDTGGWHDNAVNNTRMTIPVGVTKVRCFGQVWITANTANNHTGIFFKLNGAGFPGNGQLTVSINASSAFVTTTSAVIDVVAGDYLEFFSQPQDTSVNFDSDLTCFGIQMIA